MACLGGVASEVFELRATFCPAFVLTHTALTDANTTLTLPAMDYVVQLSALHDTAISVAAVLEYFAERYTLARQAKLRTVRT